MGYWEKRTKIKRCFQKLPTIFFSFLAHEPPHNHLLYNWDAFKKVFLTIFQNLKNMKTF